MFQRFLYMYYIEYIRNMWIRMIMYIDMVIVLLWCLRVNISALDLISEYFKDHKLIFKKVFVCT